MTLRKMRENLENAQENAKKRNDLLMDMVRDESVSVGDRADAMLFTAAENGLDYRPAFRQIIEDGDTGRKLKEKYESQGESTLTCERFLGNLHTVAGHTYATVTRGGTDVYVPAAPDDVEGLRHGDAVVVDTKTERIIGADGHCPVAGDVVPVESNPADKPGHVIIKHHDRRILARLHQDLIDQPDRCLPGKHVLYDPLRQIVLDTVETGSDGEELLVPPDKLETVRYEDVGSPHPVIEEILDRVIMTLEHPDWIQRMRARARCSYLFAGPTGSGKSFHLKLLATRIHDLVEQTTGQRSSRLVMVDASQFWTPYFGETEQRIAAWAEKLQKLGERTLKRRDGSLLRFPLIVVLEECEALLRSRSEHQASSHLFDRPLALMLQKTESLENALQVPIIWIATSNRPDLADPAALRRIGMRPVTFGTLTAHQARSVLEKKVPFDMPIRGDEPQDRAREALLNETLGYLYGPQPRQAIVEVRFANSDRRTLDRAEVVTPAVLEEAVSAAVDRCLRRSHKTDRLLGLDADDIIGFLHRHFGSLAKTLRPHNVGEHCPEWFSAESLQVTSVTPLIDRVRPNGLLID